MIIHFLLLCTNYRKSVFQNQFEFSDNIIRKTNMKNRSYI